MTNFTVLVYGLIITLIGQFTTAVKNETGIPMEQIISFHVGSNSSTSNKLTSKSHCSNLYHKAFGCWQSMPTLKEGDCATYDAEKKLVSTVDCPFFYPNRYKLATPGHILLPRNLSQLNDYMCGPLNRKGHLCSECADGFGPSVTSFGHRCANCTDGWYGVPLFLIIEFVPITIFYLIIVVFQISVTSPPMPCLIICTQFIACYFGRLSFLDKHNKPIVIDHWDLRLDMKIVLSLYQVLNLDFCQVFLPLFCVSSKLKFIHITFLDYISAFYPFLLIFLTWLCVELHGHNFRPLVWLWRPFHRRFVQLRRGWDTKSDIIDAFITIFFLTYSKILYQTVLLVAHKEVKNTQPSGTYFRSYVCAVDHSVDYGNAYHLSFAIPVILTSIVFNILPPLLLVLYPFQFFKSFLSKYHLNFITMHTFMDKAYSCYRNGLDGGRDMRSISGLYFFMAFIVYIVMVLFRVVRKYIYVNQLSTIGIVLFITILTVTITKPYQKAYMNYMDILLLSNYLILCYMLSSGYHTQVVSRILITIPIAILIVVTILRKIPANKIFNYFRRARTPSVSHSTQCSAVNTPTSAQPLIQSTSNVITYGTDNKEN